jgi:hypothetical protein
LVVAVLSAAAALVFVAIGSWYLALPWLGVGLALIPIGRSLGRRAVRLLAAALAIACVLLTFEGGLFMLPTVVAFAIAYGSRSSGLGTA